MMFNVSDMIQVCFEHAVEYILSIFRAGFKHIFEYVLIFMHQTSFLSSFCFNQAANTIYLSLSLNLIT